MTVVLTRVLQALAIAGAGITVVAVAMLYPDGLTAGVDLAAYMRAGDAVRNGGDVYTTGVAQTLAFLYPPVWAVLFAAISWLPGWLLQAAIMGLDVLALRYATGSWLAVGLLGWFPLTWFGLASGNIDILIVAAIVMAWRRSAVPLAVVALAKLSPAFALDLRRWREFVVTGLVLVAITLPWFGLWFEYAEFIARQPAVAGTMVAIPWYLRLPLAVLLLIPRRPWTSALAAVVAVPNLYWYTSLWLIAPIRLFVDEWRERRVQTPPDRASGPISPVASGRAR
jgi:hypothetical protein